MSDQQTKEKILIVDDVAEYIDILMGLLRADYKMVAATNGETALKMAQSKKPPDLILLDILLPGMSGYDVFEELKKNENTKDIPVIFLTAKDDEQEEAKGFRMGAVDYITKPISPSIVKARVKTHLTLKRARKDLERKNRELMEVNATKNKFFSIVSHDLKNYISGFIEFSAMLENIDADRKEEISDIAKTLQNCGRNMFKLLENLLNWARIMMDRMEFNPGTVSVHKAVKDNINLLQVAANNKRIELWNQVSETLTAYIDIDMFNTVLRNLISNAIKFSHLEGKIIISGSETDKTVEISVTDNGVGMTEKALDSIFRIDVSYCTMGTTCEQGTGLGLILCKELVKKHNGTIRAESRKGEGTTIRISLPKQVE